MSTNIITNENAVSQARDIISALFSADFSAERATSAIAAMFGQQNVDVYEDENVYCEVDRITYFVPERGKVIRIEEDYNRIVVKERDAMPAPRYGRPEPRNLCSVVNGEFDWRY